MLQPGDVVVGNDAFGKYKMNYKSFRTTSRLTQNRVGRIIEEELVLLEFIKPWTKFRFIEK